MNKILIPKKKNRLPAVLSISLENSKNLSSILIYKNISLATQGKKNLSIRSIEAALRECCLLEIVLTNKLRKIRRMFSVYLSHMQSSGADKVNNRKLVKEHRNILLNGKISCENETSYLIGRTVKPPAFCSILVHIFQLQEGWMTSVIKAEFLI